MNVGSTIPIRRKANRNMVRPYIVEKENAIGDKEHAAPVAGSVSRLCITASSKVTPIVYFMLTPSKRE
jgi:hypothetical protein